MSERVFVGNDGSAGFKLRVGLPGVNARTAAIDKLALHENMDTMYPYEEGIRTVNAGSSVGFTLAKNYVSCPFIIIRCDRNIIPGPHSFYAALKYDTNRLTLFNRMSFPLDIKYCVFGQLPNQLANPT